MIFISTIYCDTKWLVLLSTESKTGLNQVVQGSERNFDHNILELHVPQSFIAESCKPHFLPQAEFFEYIAGDMSVPL